LKKVTGANEMVLHLTEDRNKIFGGTNRADTWMIWHDALSILWEKNTQAWLKTLKCPIEGWPERTWADRFIKLRGKYNDMVVKRYKDCLPGDSPELMPLDCHLFADIKEGTARNVALTFFLNDEDPRKYSMRGPNHVYRSINRTIKAGCPDPTRIVEDCEGIIKNIDRIIAADGCYISDKNINAARNGFRKTQAYIEKRAKKLERKKNPLKFVDPVAIKAFEYRMTTKLNIDYHLTDEELAEMSEAVVVTDGEGPEEIEDVEVLEDEDEEELEPALRPHREVDAAGFVLDDGEDDDDDDDSVALRSI